MVTNIGNPYFTCLDPALGTTRYLWQRVTHLTTFLSPDDHYEYMRMPFGLVYAPAVFQSMINKALGVRRFELAITYLGDLLSTGRTLEEAIVELLRTLTSL